jgi:hypothetical protein
VATAAPGGVRRGDGDTGPVGRSRSAPRPRIEPQRLGEERERVPLGPVRIVLHAPGVGAVNERARRAAPVVVAGEEQASTWPRSWSDVGAAR